MLLLRWPSLSLCSCWCVDVVDRNNVVKAAVVRWCWHQQSQLIWCWKLTNTFLGALLAAPEDPPLLLAPGRTIEDDTNSNNFGGGGLAKQPHCSGSESPFTIRWRLYYGNVCFIPALLECWRYRAGVAPATSSSSRRDALPEPTDLHE